ncbi:hypothetical protein NJB1507_03370 [Mycobacterium marinum]|nr:hypothetical protein NJB1507_03370 [Mycobacterium marinum]
MKLARFATTGLGHTKPGCLSVRQDLLTPRRFQLSGTRGIHRGNNTATLALPDVSHLDPPAGQGMMSVREYLQRPTVPGHSRSDPGLGSEEDMPIIDARWFVTFVQRLRRTAH